ncbi:MAG: hypothetical protein KGL39_30930 [Patescibacteria group bacterium]|nr:hypothetical protein [Patescibacteria group bacterium]
MDCDRAAKGAGAEWFVNVWQGAKFSTYWLVPLTSDFGLAYQFQASRTKAPGEMQLDAYDVLIEVDGHSCTCPGHLRHGHCKHVDTLKLLIERGTLGRPVPDPDTLGEPCGQCFPDDPPTEEELLAYKPAGHDHGIPF